MFFRLKQSFTTRNHINVGINTHAPTHTFDDADDNYPLFIIVHCSYIGKQAFTERMTEPFQTFKQHTRREDDLIMNFTTRSKSSFELATSTITIRQYHRECPLSRRKDTNIRVRTCCCSSIWHKKENSI